VLTSLASEQPAGTSWRRALDHHEEGSTELLIRAGSFDPISPVVRDPGGADAFPVHVQLPERASRRRANAPLRVDMPPGKEARHSKEQDTMYAAIRRGKGTPGSVHEAVRRIQEVYVPTLRTLPGFVGIPSSPSGTTRG
jgi:hypothetical protein